jgi:Bacterial aa3 type cytochrome c oxidase subunit IV
MADHGQVEYATAQGNDLAEHEATYRNFVQLTYVGSIHVANFVIGLAIGATTGHWMISRSCYRREDSQHCHAGALASCARFRRVRLSRTQSVREFVVSH